MTDRGKFLPVFISCAAGIAFDQAAKFLALASIKENQEIPVIPGFFDLTLRFNRGAAFSFFESLPPLFFFVISIAAIALLLYFIAQLSSDQTGQLSALGAVLGGALGNLLDRARIGVVVDFLLFHFKSLSWPAFNIADTLIVLGVFAFLYCNLRHGDERKSKAP